MSVHNAEGAYVWLIPDGFMPESSLGDIESHEAISFLNTATQDANVSISFYFTDRDPIKDVQVTIGAERTRHIRTANKEALGVEVPKGVPYAIRVQSDVPVTVQYSRMDGRQEAMGLMTTMAFPIEQRQN